MNIYLVARKSCSDAAMIFKQEANINRLNLNQSKWTDRLPDVQLVDSKGWSKMFEEFRMLWHLLEGIFNCCELEDSLPGLIVQKWKLSMLAEFTCESFSRTVRPFTLEAKGTEACYFQPGQDFRLTKILTLCKLKTCQVCLGLVRLQFYKSKTQPNT